MLTITQQITVKGAAKMIKLLCPRCLRATDFRPMLRFPNGAEALQCMGCGNRFLQHKCAHDHPASQPSLLPIVLGAMSVFCPDCKALYSFGDAVAQFKPDVGKGIMAFALLLFGVVILGKLDRKSNHR
jgi:hypothetical protein